MDRIDREWDKVLRDLLQFHKVVATIVRSKLKEKGITLSPEQVQAIEDQLKDADPANFEIEFDDRTRAQLGDDDIKLYDSDLEKFVEDFSERMKEATPGLLAEFADHILISLKRDAPRMLTEHRIVQTRFRGNLRQNWGDALNLLEMLVVIAYEAGEEFNREIRPLAVEERDLVFEVLCRLHARACQVANEVLILLKNGYADGAHARWRTLHEIAVVGFFVKAHGNETAERYQLHQVVETYQAATQYQEYCAALGDEPFEQQELDEMRANAERLIQRYGGKFRTSYGWAVQALGPAVKDGPTFKDIEKSIGLDHLRPYYKMASYNVHPCSKSMHFRLGLVESDGDILLAGPSGAGLADPGQGTAISLHQITTALLTTRPNMDRTTVCLIMQKLVDEICDAFAEVEMRVEQDCLDRDASDQVSGE